MELSVLTTTYSKFLPRMAVHSLGTFAPSNSNSKSDIPTNGWDLDSRSKVFPQAKGKKHREFNRFLKEGVVFPCKVMKYEKYARLDMLGTRKRWLNLLVEDNSLHAEAVEEVDDDPLPTEEYQRNYYGDIDLPQSRYKLNNVVFNRKQMMVRNTCDRRRWFTSRTTYAVSNATDVESNAFSSDADGDAINVEDPRTLHSKVFFAASIKEMDSLDFESVVALVRYRDHFFEQKHNIILEYYGLFKMEYTDLHVDGGSKLMRYLSVEDFMWFFLRIDEKYRKRIYNYMFKQQIYVLDNYRGTLAAIVCFWEAPPSGWYKLNVSGFCKEDLGGTKEAGCGAVLRDSRGRILEIFHKPFPDTTYRDEVLRDSRGRIFEGGNLEIFHKPFPDTASRDELFLLGVYHGIYETLQRRLKVKRIILEIDHKKIFKLLSHYSPSRMVDDELYEFFRNIFYMLSKFDDYEIKFQLPQGNSLANRVAYIASHLTVGQRFPIFDKCFETQVKCDQLEIPRYEVFLEEEESSDEDI
ncbi:uncharacterized protein LOC132278585 isoform X2 [Cornus florida]|uniref:uncharacterized protein LOC132278585 isoform X2 n=1 Tax=Cornus florida TaxID=4283 RepID=UPI00289BE2F3|nr:uncharacterized protein LOC132278585 isoform X2 [Cornus florida]